MNKYIIFIFFEFLDNSLNFSYVYLIQTILQNTQNYWIQQAFLNGLIVRSQMQHLIWCNGLKSFIHKRTRHIGPWKWQSCGIRWHDKPNLAKTFWKKKVRLALWMEKKAQNLFSQIKSQGILWIPNKIIM